MKDSKKQKTDDNFKATCHKDMLRNMLRRNSWKPSTSCFPDCETEVTELIDEAYHREDSDLAVHLIDVSDTGSQYLRFEVPGELAPTYMDFRMEDVSFSSDGGSIQGCKKTPNLELIFIPLSAVLGITYYARKEA